MPFLAWLRGSAPPSLASEVERLAASPLLHALFDWFTRHEREIADFQLAITAIPAPSFSEQQRAAWLASRLSGLGLEIQSDEVGNLLCLRPGAAVSEPIAISAHLDTVFPSSTELRVQRDHTRLLGPGIGDNAAGLAALWALARALHECGIRTATPLLFIANVGEEGEGSLRGMRHLYRDHLAALSQPVPLPDSPPASRLAAHIALDGAGHESIISQALGCRRLEILFTGPGGHSWSDFGAPNPIAAASLTVAALLRIPLPVSPRTTLSVGVIEGGTSINTIPERALIRVDLRSSSPEHLDSLERQLRLAVANARDEAAAHASYAADRLIFEIRSLDARPAGELPSTSPLLAAVRAVDSQLGIRSQVLRASTDANIPLSLGLEALTLGAGGLGGGAHTLQEWFDPVNRDLALRRVSLLTLLLAGLAEANSSATPLAAPEIPSESF